MKPARLAAHKALLAITVLAGAFALTISSAQASAGSPQTCTVGSSCEIGEFLYDDDYTPITTASCDITSRYPDGTIFLNSQAMTAAAENDGWYSHSFTAPTTEGQYRTNVCCTVSGELLCVDKSFEVTSDSSAPSESDIADAVWGYSNRTLSGFGSLVSDIWNYTTRSLTSFGSLGSDVETVKDDVANIKEDVEDIKTSEDTSQATIQETRLLIEQLVNKPIIENVIEEEVPDLGGKLENSKTATDTLSSKTSETRKKAQDITTNWRRYSSNELLDLVLELNSQFGEEGDDYQTSVFGAIAYLNRSWDWQEAEAAHKEAKSIKNSLLSAQTALSSYKSSSLAYNEMKSVIAGLSRLESTLGSSSDPSYKRTIYAKLNETQQLAKALDEREKEVDRVLANWNEVKDDSNLSRKIDNLLKRVIAINRIPKVRTILTSAFEDIEPDKLLKNKLLAGRGVINSNRKLLAQGSGKSISVTWLEEGSIVFKTIITNPSNLISQEVPVKYYLPPEVREEDVIDADEGLSVKYDTEKDQYYVEGAFTLAAGQTRTLRVRVEDIWYLTETEIESMKARAQELSQPLEGTAYFAQGVTLKSDITASLDKVITLQESAVTPEQKIRNYREAQIEYQAAQNKLDSLQQLVTEAGSTGTLFGFVGGAQAVAVWGLIIIMVAGFVFLALYMKTINSGTITEEKKGKKKGKGKKKAGSGLALNFRQIAKAAIPFLLFGVMTATVSGLIVARVVSGPSEEKKEVLGTEEESSPEEEEKKDEDEVSQNTLDDLAIGGQDIVRVNVPDASSVNLREEPSLDAAVITRVKTSQEAERIGEEGEWTNIIISELDSLESTTEGWIHSDFIEEGPTDDLFEDEIGYLEETVTIDETPTGWLRVREYPKGPEITKIYPGDTYPLLAEDDGWYQIEFGDGTSGWISGEYASID